MPRGESNSFTRIFCKKLPDRFEPSNVFTGILLRLKILIAHGKTERAFNELEKTFLPMASLTGTLWEFKELRASLNHGYCSYIAYVIIRRLTGYIRHDAKNKIIYIEKAAETDYDFTVKLPIKNGRAVFVNKNGALSVTPPQGYKVEEI